MASLPAIPTGLARYRCQAPPLMWSEALSAIVEGAYRGDIPASALDAVLERLVALPITAAEVDADHRRRSLRLARSLGWAKSYDAEYIALAQHLGCPVLTLDARLMRGAGQLIEFVGPATLVDR